jgi:hypothetical protein
MEGEQDDLRRAYLDGGDVGADNLQDGRVVKGSKVTYGSRLTMIKCWCKNFAPENYDATEDKSIFPLPIATLRRFLALKKTQLRKGDKVKVRVTEDGQHNIEATIFKYCYSTNQISIKYENQGRIYVFGEENIISRNFVSYDTFSGYRSALKHAYQNQRVAWDLETSIVVKAILAGYLREVADHKQEGEMDINEGKMPITFTGMYTAHIHALHAHIIVLNNYFVITTMSCVAYRILAAAALGIAMTTGTVVMAGTVMSVLWYAHVYLVLQWNLMSRTNNVSTTSYEHMWWENDALVIYTPKQKNDPNGARAYPKHVFANPLDPQICPILALALWLIGCSACRQEDNNNRLFCGTFCDDKFGDWLSKTLGRMNQSVKDLLGVDISDIGTHSLRKGVATYEAGMIGGASMVAIFIRIGWSLGNVPHRYLHAGEGSDQLVGRIACGLPFLDVEFLTLPPHFDNTMALTEEEWEDIVPGYGTLPQRFKTAVPFILASLVYHTPWLQANLPHMHPLFNCRYWRNGWHIKLQPKVLLGVGKCPVTHLQATGIPTHLVIARRLQIVERELEGLIESNKRNQVDRIQQKKS